MIFEGENNILNRVPKAVRTAFFALGATAMSMTSVDGAVHKWDNNDLAQYNSGFTNDNVSRVPKFTDKFHSAMEDYYRKEYQKLEQKEYKETYELIRSLESVDMREFVDTMVRLYGNTDIAITNDDMQIAESELVGELFIIWNEIGSLGLVISTQESFGKSLFLSHNEAIKSKTDFAIFGESIKRLVSSLKKFNSRSYGAQMYAHKLMIEKRKKFENQQNIYQSDEKSGS